MVNYDANCNHNRNLRKGKLMWPKVVGKGAHGRNGSQNIYRILMDEVDLRVCIGFGRVVVNIWVCRENGLPAYLVGVWWGVTRNLIIDMVETNHGGTW